MGVIYWIYPNLILANSPVGVEIIDMLPAGSPTRCTVRHSWMARYPATDAAQRAFHTRSTHRSTQRYVTRTSSCCRSAAMACATVSMITW